MKPAVQAFVLSLALAAAGAAAASLSIDSIRATLTVGEMTLRSTPNTMGFSLSSPSGSYSGSVSNGTMPLASLDAHVDADSGTVLTLNSKPLRRKDCDYLFRTTLTARPDRPGVLVEMALRNVGAYPAETYFYFLLTPVQCGYYEDEDGEQRASTGVIRLKRWLYLPTSNNAGGYGLVFPEPGDISFETLYPRPDWRKPGWYFIPRGRRDLVQPGGEKKFSFLVFPAGSAAEVAAVALASTSQGRCSTH